MASGQPGQLGLFGHDPSAIDEAFARVERRELPDGAWVDYAPGWLAGHERVFDALARSTRWRTLEEHLYDRTVQAPRLVASMPEDGPGHPILESMRRALSRRYGEDLVRVSLAMYRDGRDSVAWHGDRIARCMSETVVATVSLGAPRRFLLRRHGGGASIAFRVGWGDLLVMGGSCQRTHQHSVPKVAHADPRIAVMFRPKWDDTPY